MLIEISLKHIEYMETQVKDLDLRIDELISKHNHKEKVELLDTIPGVDEVGAKAIIAEIGSDMSVFPTADHLASWGGVSPGNNESTGKKSGKTTHGDKWLISMLVQCALCASRTKGTYLRDKYHKLKTRRGAKKAAVAIAHKILVSAYYMLKQGVPYSIEILERTI